MALVAMYPAAGQTVYDEFGALITADGIIATIDAYYEPLLIQGKLLRGDPLDTNVRPVYRLRGLADGVAGLLTIALASTAAIGDTQTVETIGYAAAGDMGGSSFRASAQIYTANGYTIINGADGWQWSMLDTTGISIKCFGAKGDGATIDTTATRAFFAYVPQGSNGYVPAGNYLIDDTVTISTPEAAYRAINGTSTDGQESIFTWVGSGTSGTMFRYAARDSVFAGLSFAVGASKTVLYSMSFEYAGAVITRPTFENCYWGTLNSTGVMTWALAVDPNATAPGNMEFASFRMCNFASPTWIRGGQPYGWVYDNCTFGSNVPGGTGWADGLGIQVDSQSCDLSFIECKAGKLSVFLKMSRPIQYRIVGGDYENVKRLVEQTGGSVNAGDPGFIFGGRHALGGYNKTASRPTITASDNRYIILTCGGQGLSVDSIPFGQIGVAPLWHIDVRGYTSVSLRNCTVPNPLPITRGGKYLSEPTGGTYLQAVKFGQVDPGTGLTIARVPDTHGGENGSGTVTISGAATSQAFLFASDVWGQNEADTDYRVFFTQLSTTNTPAAAARSSNVWTTSKTVAGFTANIGTAPGVGNSITYAWRVEA